MEKKKKIEEKQKIEISKIENNEKDEKDEKNEKDRNKKDEKDENYEKMKVILKKYALSFGDRIKMIVSGGAPLAVEIKDWMRVSKNEKKKKKTKEKRKKKRKNKDNKRKDEQTTQNRKN